MNDEACSISAPGTAVDDLDFAAITRALSHPARVRIVRLLAEQAECRGAEVFSGIPLAQSTISEHLRVLKEAGLVSSHPVGTAMTYCLSREPLERLVDAVRSIVDTMPTCDTGPEGNEDMPAASEGCRE